MSNFVYNAGPNPTRAYFAIPVESIKRIDQQRDQLWRQQLKQAAKMVQDEREAVTTERSRMFGDSQMFDLKMCNQIMRIGPKYKPVIINHFLQVVWNILCIHRTLKNLCRVWKQRVCA